jgi:4-hydroxy-3-methylbut-2-enyl diphosphate reductase
MAPRCDLVLVVGSKNSSNSVRLVEVALSAGAGAAHLIDYAREIDDAWLDGVETVGVTSGASAPEHLVVRVCDWFRARGVTDIKPYQLDVDEDVVFRLPVELRRELELAANQ